MQLDLQLPDRQGVSNEVVPGSARSEIHGGVRGGCGPGLGFIEIEESRERGKLCALDINF